MDQLTLKGMSFHARHGYFDEEKVKGNDFEVDLIFKLSLEEAGRSDNLQHTIDYGKARALVEEILMRPPINLIEHLCLLIGEQLFNTFQPEKLKVKVRKLNPPMEGDTRYSEVSMKWPR